MPFATEEQVREEGFLEDTNEIPSDQLTQSLEKAHLEILDQTWLTDESQVSDTVIHAESLLAISHFFRSIAISSAVSAEKWKSATLQVNGHERVRNLMLISEQLRQEAWGALQSYRKETLLPCVLMTRGEET